MLLVAVDCRTSFLRMSRIPNAASLWMSESTLATSTPSAMTAEGVITDGTAREEIDGPDGPEVVEGSINASRAE